jgi:hypothetical protein
VRSIDAAASAANFAIKPHRLRHRQPEREERGKRGPSVDPHGFDAGNLIKGKKRHILVDMQGLLLHAIVHSAGAAVCGKYMPQRCQENVQLYLRFTFLFCFFIDQVFAFSEFLTAS